MPSLWKHLVSLGTQAGQGGRAARTDHHLHAKGRGRLDPMADRQESHQEQGGHVAQAREASISSEGRKSRAMDFRHGRTCRLRLTEVNCYAIFDTVGF